MNAWVETRFASYSYWYLNGRPPSTDTRGRYELIEMPIGSTVYLDLHKTDYLQQCAFEITLDGTPQRLDAQLVRRESLFVSPDSAPSAPGFRNVYGVVYQNTGGGRVPAANSAVAFEAGPDFDAARTVTDARGRFLLCGLSRVRTLRIVAYGSGNRPAYHSVAPGPDEEIEIDVE